MIDAGAEPADIGGRPPSSLSGEQPDPGDDLAGVVARACLYRENRRNTGDLCRWVRDPTERPRGTGRAGGGVGGVHSVRWAASGSGGFKSLRRPDEGRRIQKRG
jgi:hypothetical protein